MKQLKTRPCAHTYPQVVDMSGAIRDAPTQGRAMRGHGHKRRCHESEPGPWRTKSCVQMRSHIMSEKKSKPSRHNNHVRPYVNSYVNIYGRRHECAVILSIKHNCLYRFW